MMGRMGRYDFDFHEGFVEHPTLGFIPADSVLGMEIGGEVYDQHGNWQGDQDGELSDDIPY